VFMFVVWFWLLVTVASDLFRRRDVSGLGKAAWVILLLVLPYIGIFAYLLSQGRGMSERHEQQAQRARNELGHVVGFSAADEIAKLESLKSSGAISPEECARLRARMVQ
jgi:hypothetical protein